MSQISRAKRKFDSLDNFKKGFILLIFGTLLLSMLITFTGVSPFSVTNIEGKSEFIKGESQTFKILLKAVDPEQFTTSAHYREQYGRWRIEDADGNVLSSGRLTKIDGGTYDRVITIQIPAVPSFLISEIIEYQYSVVGDQSYMDDGTVRASEVIPLTLQKCSSEGDCSGNFCSGQYAMCIGGYCEAGGTCATCTTTDECSINEECLQGKCFKIAEPSVFEEMRETLATPITETGKSTDDTLAPKTAPIWLIWANLIMWVVLGVLFFVAQKTGKLRKRF